MIATHSLFVITERDLPIFIAIRHLLLPFREKHKPLFEYTYSHAQMQGLLERRNGPSVLVLYGRGDEKLLNDCASFVANRYRFPILYIHWNVGIVPNIDRVTALHISREVVGGPQIVQDKLEKILKLA